MCVCDLLRDVLVLWQQTCRGLWTNWVEIVDQGLVVDDLTISLMAVCRCEDLFVF